MSATDRFPAELITQLYQELHSLAHTHLRGERTGHTLSTTALVHETYLRLSTQLGLANLSRSEFFGAASRTMRRVLVDHARTRSRAKRGGGENTVPLNEASFLSDTEADELLLLEDALERLRERNPRAADVVEQRFFAGLTLEEVAEVLGVSKKTVQRDWIAAQAWLRKEIAGDSRLFPSN